MQLTELNWRRILRLDLDCKLQFWKNRYRKNAKVFDYLNVHCWVSEYGDKWYVGASTYCADPDVHDFSAGNTFTFFRSKKFLLKSEAVAHLEREVITASKKHKETKFYREKGVHILQDEKLIPISQEEYFFDGYWFPAFHRKSYRKCTNCGLRTDAKICTGCGLAISG